MKRNLLLILVLLLIVSACSQEPEQTPPPEEMHASSTFTAVPPTDTLEPTATATQEPTITPTQEPTLTPTPRPTFSPETITVPAGEPVKIAYLLWETHPLGLDEIRAVEIAVADFGSEIHGHPIELTGLNSECNEFAGQQGAKLLMQDKSILGVIGASCSVPSFKAAEVISENNRVLISPSATNPDLTAFDTHESGFLRTAPNDLVQIEAAAKYAYNQLGAKTMAVVRGENARFQRLYSQTLCDSFSELGGECVADIPKTDGSTYVTPIINSIVSADPDAVYFLGWNLKEGAAFLKAANASEELSETALFLWGETYNRADFLREAGEDAVGAYVSRTSYDIDQGSASYQTFLASFRERYGEDPQNIYHPYAYDATMLLLTAISENAVPQDDGSLMVDPLAIRETLYSKVGFQGISGYISCSEQGDCLSTAYAFVYEFVSGDPATFNPGPADLLSSNPVRVWP